MTLGEVFTGGCWFLCPGDGSVGGRRGSGVVSGEAGGDLAEIRADWVWSSGMLWGTREFF